MTTYKGVRLPTGEIRVTKDDEPLPVWRSYQLLPLAPAGFDWGSSRVTVAQLALAILLEELGHAEAVQLYDRFRWAILVHLSGNTWSFTSRQVQRWAAQQREAAEEGANDPC